MNAQEIIEKIRAEIERHKELFKEACDCGSYYACARRDEANEILEVLSDLEKEEKPKRVRTLEEEFDGYNPIVVTLDKYVLEGIGIGRHDKVIIKFQRKED